MANTQTPITRVSHENLAQILKRRTRERLLDMDTLCDLENHNHSVDAIMSEMTAIFDPYASAQRILSYYADLPQMFFTLLSNPAYSLSIRSFSRTIIQSGLAAAIFSICVK